MNIKNKWVILAATISTIGCATRGPVQSIPQTPKDFLVATQQPGDQSLSCSEISSQFRYGIIYMSALDQAFDPKSPALVRSPSYTTTDGIVTRYGNTAFGSSTSTTYGGGSVMVYDTLTARMLVIKDSVEKRQKELKNLAQRRGDCSPDDLQSSNKLLDNLKRNIKSGEEGYARNKDIYSSYEKKAIAENWSAKDRRYQKTSYQDALREEMQSIDQNKSKYQELLKQHKALYDRAEKEAQSKRQWFDQNTAIVNK